MEHDQTQDEVRGHLSGTGRTVTVDGETGRTMTLRRHYDADVADVWQACTDPERLARWLTPVSGDLRPGGQPVTQVEAELVAAGGGTDLELRHGGPVDPGFWTQFGPGAVGVGWDLALYVLGRVLAGQQRPDQTAGPGSEPYRELVTGSSQSWQAAAEAAGIPPDQAKAAADRTTAFYTGAEA